MLSLQMNTAWESVTTKHPHINMLYVPLWLLTELNQQDLTLLFQSYGQNSPLPEFAFVGHIHQSFRSLCGATWPCWAQPPPQGPWRSPVLGDGKAQILSGARWGDAELGTNSA